VRSAAPEAAAPAAATEPAAPDPRRQDAEWQAVEQARYEEPVIGIVKFNDYLDRFPDSPFKADVARYTDEAVDRIWWNRIAELFAQRDAARKEIADRRVQLKQSQDPEFKKGLEEEIARFEQQVKDVDGIVRGEMKYAGQTPPNLYDSNELKILRANRDAKNYATWKDAVLSSVKRSRGERLPWRSSR
jgi:TolA-binding protein